MDTTRPAPAVLLKGFDLRKPAALAKLNVLVFGKSGVGKTALAGTAEDDDRSAPVLVLDTEGGTQTLIKRGARLDIVTLDENIYKRLQSLQGQLDRMVDNDERLPYRTIVLDSITMLGQHLMRDITTAEVPERSHWQRYNSQIRAIADWLTGPSFPCHLIVTGHEKEDEDTHTIGIALQGGIRQDLAHKFGTVGRMYTTLSPDPKDPKARVTRRRLLVANTATVEAKDRMNPDGTLPSEMESPTVTMLLERLYAHAGTAS